MSEAVAVRCTRAGQAALHVRIENQSDRTVHVFKSDRMPYLIVDGDGLLVLYGVNPPNPDVDYYAIEIPTTRPLASGEAIESSERHLYSIQSVLAWQHLASADPVEVELSSA
ncbi:MAG: hypothetical protein QOD83_2026 [Solirubrobacteraceae bacterium]|jgi:hypothetical protein|nr:hypothetical protein [Solirubrobacteraceae bacterium]